ncbi:MAG: DUF4258 domain-containing protein [Planctomycetia bacterium]|nr:DUF4258 domain-containing protein [Candidatus Brocadia sp.]QOJ06254.1 MAG: DUF4258 domain-containing protein [Planctomycetia bacterium]TVL94789.1 MAG: hypothetical protein CV082_13435 [Candidatus Brocadia sp. BL1]HQU32172.1 hypothetical protein [Candidatus Brocadia sapporoensis]
MKILWTKHAEERQKEWEKKLGITKQAVEDLVNSPEQIVPGDMDALVAQKRVQNGLLRAPFVEMGKSRKILTVYWTSKVERYWKEEV